MLKCATNLREFENRHLKKRSMKRILIIALTLFLQINLAAQEIKKPDYGLTISSTGLAVCGIGTTMKSSAIQMYSPQYGYTHVNFENSKQARLKLHTLALGGLMVIVGIIIRNVKKRGNDKNRKG